MTRKVSDEKLGRFARIQTDLFRRVAQDTIPAEEAIEGIKAIIARKFAVNPSGVPRKVKKPVDPTYPARFAAAIEAGGFTWWNRDRLTPENFPSETFDGGDYDLEWRKLPSNPNGYNADEIDAVVLAWQKEDATILGSASAGDGLFLAKEFKTGRRNQPNGWIVCPGSTSVDGGAFYLSRDDADRYAYVDSCESWWNDGGFVLVRKVREP